MADKGKRVEVVGYMRTSSATNVGDGKDSEARQRKAIEECAWAFGAVIVDWFYDVAVSGADPIEARPGFAALLAASPEMASARSSSRRQTASPAISWSRKSATQCCGAWA
jgi:Resolvase, N terminal domain